ncbi:hypothetical protein QUB80_32625 [Chlorogloeopsis sp. ULAP01]|uniref:hypothetical protein n=1 Tax=Chlorogloeopsis sp. ULAP01 TaxID=3056483 RepID=UPI0025AAE7E5|nr:hypothetical protein [Chlorogloeopsis sp. ULAP01]MDM9385400.1 hypothetical protein [Chlorogloeopsis sp. ULAP01]
MQIEGDRSHRYKHWYQNAIAFSDTLIRGLRSNGGVERQPMTNTLPDRPPICPLQHRVSTLTQN